MTWSRVFPQKDCSLCIVTHDSFMSHFDLINNISALWVISSYVSFGAIRWNLNSLIRHSLTQVQKWRFSFLSYVNFFIFIPPFLFCSCNKWKAEGSRHSIRSCLEELHPAGGTGCRQTDQSKLEGCALLYKVCYFKMLYIQLFLILSCNWPLYILQLLWLRVDQKNLYAWIKFLELFFTNILKLNVFKFQEILQ